MTASKKIDELYDLIEGIETAMFTTRRADGHLVDLLALDALRDHRAPANVRPGAAHRRDGPLVDDGQARSALPER